MNSNSLSHFFSKWTSHALLFTGAGTENPFLPKDNHDYERRKGTVEKNVIFRIEFSSSCFLRFFFLFPLSAFFIVCEKSFFSPSFHHSHHPSYTREQLKLTINIWRLAHLLFQEHFAKKPEQFNSFRREKLNFQFTHSPVYDFQCCLSLLNLFHVIKGYGEVRMGSSNSNLSLHPRRVYTRLTIRKHE